MGLLRIINTVLINRGREEIKSLSNDLHLKNDIGFESLDLAELTARIEAEYDIDIFEDGIVYTVGDIIAKLEK